jgi:hypothetical protein
MEETDMCLNPTLSAVVAQPLFVGACPAKALGPEQRQELAVHALAGSQSITHLAEQFQVSRKFVYQAVSGQSQIRLPTGGHRTERERDIFKKALAIFSQGT